MRRIMLLALLLASTPAPAQQPGRLLGGAPAPPAMMPGPTISPGYASPPRQYVFPNRPPIDVPGGPSGFSDKVVRCNHAGASAGLGPNENAAFTRHCANAD